MASNNKVCVNIDQTDPEHGGFTDAEKLQARKNTGAADVLSLAESFESRAPNYNWSANEVCTRGGKLWQFDRDHSGAWTGEDAHETTILEVLKLVTRPLGFVTPEMFGAKGDGIKDDTQSVIDAVASGKNLLLVGVYRITGLVKIPRTCRVLRTTGSFSVDAFDTDTQTGGWVFFSYPELPVTPEMFGAIGDGVADDTKAIQNAIDANLDPSVFPIGKTQAEAGFGHTKHSALTVVLTNTYKISGAILVRGEQHFNPLTIDGGKKANISGSITDDANYIDYGIRILKPDNYPQGDIDTQTRKHIYGLGFMRFKTAIYFGGADWDSSVEHCFFQDISVDAIYLRESDGTLVKDNYCSWVWGKFIHLWYTNACRVIGNHSGEYGTNPPGGILVEYGMNSPNIITDNVLKGCGITIQNRNNIGDIIANNVIKNTLSDAGITISSSAVGVNIHGNTLMNCTIGVDIFGKQTLRGNTFVGCAIGAKLDGYQHTRIVVDDNDFEKCTTGIYHVEASWDNVFKDNVFRENTTAIESGGVSMKSVVDGNFFIECMHLYSRTPSSSGNDPIFGTNYTTQSGFETGSLTEPV